MLFDSIEVPSKYVRIHGLGMYAGSSVSTTGMPRIFPASVRFGRVSPEHPFEVDQVMHEANCNERPSRSTDQAMTMSN
jgi:hypothetical protein